MAEENSVSPHQYSLLKTAPRKQASSLLGVSSSRSSFSPSLPNKVSSYPIKRNLAEKGAKQQ
ncbi:MAG: hypothetical protein V3T83_06675, partial [Acidobacteriota bacterium]